MRASNPSTLLAKPFLKWAGGKGQLIKDIEVALPRDLLNKKELTYIEPFVGSGAVMFWFLKRFPNVKRAVINDINSDLTQAYQTIKDRPSPLIQGLTKIQKDYSRVKTEEDKRKFFLEKRSDFNSRKLSLMQNTVLLIFLNKTCFNGLYRVNSKNQFNVPFGRHDNPTICDPETIMADSKILQRVTILNGDYTDTLKHTTRNSFFYFDPPYKPISKTASFNAYAKNSFDDSEQVRLKEFCRILTSSGFLWLLSNSDPKNINPNDNFFDELYRDKSITIDRIKARRAINSNSSKRGTIHELLIRNYTL